MNSTLRYILLIIVSLVVLSNKTISQKIGGWYATDSLIIKRSLHAGVQMNNGNILISGGYTVGNPDWSSETEIFDIKTKKWSTGIPMNKGRGHHNLIRLKDSSILAIGGYNENSCEILNNDCTKWEFTDSLKKKRNFRPSVTLMNDGNVLMIGGVVYNQDSKTDEAIKECEIYNYLIGKWDTIPSLNTGRFSHTATLLQNGKVLVTGGMTIKEGTVLLNTCEVFDPITNEWVYAAPMHYPRTDHSATLLQNGKVLVVGGQQNNCELYDPSLDQWKVVGSVNLAAGHNRAFVLGNEQYLLLVHDYNDFMSWCGWELFSLKSYESVYYEGFKRSIHDQVIVKLDNDNVLVAGGEESVILGGGLVLRPVAFCQIFNINYTGIKDEGKLNSQLPQNLTLNCYPNPFNSTTNISTELSSSQKIYLDVYNFLGQIIKTIYTGELSTGKHIFQLNLNNYSSGIYFIRMSSSNEAHSIKIIYLK